MGEPVRLREGSCAWELSRDLEGCGKLDNGRGIAEPTPECEKLRRQSDRTMIGRDENPLIDELAVDAIQKRARSSRTQSRQQLIAQILIFLKRSVHHVHLHNGMCVADTA